MCKFMIMHKFFFLVFVLRGNGRRKNFTSSISVYFYLKSCSLIGENFTKALRVRSNSEQQPFEETRLLKWLFTSKKKRKKKTYCCDIKFKFFIFFLSMALFMTSRLFCFTYLFRYFDMS